MKLPVTAYYFSCYLLFAIIYLFSQDKFTVPKLDLMILIFYSLCTHVTHGIVARDFLMNYRWYQQTQRNFSPVPSTPVSKRFKNVKTSPIFLKKSNALFFKLSRDKKTSSCSDNTVPLKVLSNGKGGGWRVASIDQL
jgi:hypothetical protein